MGASPCLPAVFAALLLATPFGRVEGADELTIGDPVDSVDLSGEAAHKQNVDGMIQDLTPEIESGRLSGDTLRRALLVRCWAYNEKELLGQALSDCNRVLADRPDHGDALLLRGSVMTKQGKYAAAIADFDHAIADGALEPGELALAYLRRAIVRQATGDGVRASEDVKQAVALDPKLMTTYREISDAMLGRRRSRDAVAAFDEVLGLDPNSAESFVDRGLGRMARGQLDDAIADFDQALRIDRYAGAAYRARGEARFYKGLTEDAAADFKLALEFDPHFAPTSKALAILEFDQARFDEAAKHLAVAVKADAKDAYAVLWLFLARQRAAGKAAGETGGATELTRQMSNVALGEWPAPMLRYYAGQRDLAALLAAAGRGDAKGRPLRECEAHFFAGEHALLSGDRAGATALLQKASAECPAATAASVIARTELARLGG